MTDPGSNCDIAYAASATVWKAGGQFQGAQAQSDVEPRFSKRLYRERTLIERFFSKLKHFRWVAIRYDKLAATSLATAQLAAMRLRLRPYEPTT